MRTNIKYRWPWSDWCHNFKDLCLVDLLKMSRAVLFLGSAGQGKSTLNNKLVGFNASVVSHRMVVDGTSDLILIQAPSDKDLMLIDTPGLKSNNFPVSMTEKVQELCADKKLLIVLVINKNAERVTDYMKDFERTFTELVGSGKVFLIVWTHDGVLSEENRQDMQKKFPNAIMCDDGDLSTIKTHFSNAALFSSQLRCIPRLPPPLPPPPARLAPPSNAPRSATATAAVSQVARMPRSLALGLTQTVNVQQLASYSGAVPTRFPHLLQEALKIKKEGKERYRNMRLMGDAMLKSTVMSILVCVGEDRTLEGTTLPVIGNDESCAMPQFFRKYIIAEFVKHYPDREEYSSTHHQADMVEVLLELSRTTKKGGATFVFIIMELFKFVKLGHVVDKIKGICT